MADYPMVTQPGKDKKPPNTANICDYNQNLLSDVVKQVKVGTPVSLSLKGKVTRIEEQYGSGMDRCEIGLEPSAVTLAGGGRSRDDESMVDQMNREQRQKAGQYDYDEEDEEE